MRSFEQFEARIDASIRERAAALAAWELGDALGSPLQALLLPTFHPAVRLTLFDGEVDVAVSDSACTSLESREVVTIPATELAALLDGLDARLARPRSHSRGVVRDGITGAVRAGATTITGHFAVLEPDDPLLVACEFLRLTLAHARRRSTVPALEAVSRYLESS